jgi:hypothetical protein
MEDVYPQDEQDFETAVASDVAEEVEGDGFKMRVAALHPRAHGAGSGRVRRPGRVKRGARPRAASLGPQQRALLLRCNWWNSKHDESIVTVPAPPSNARAPASSLLCASRPPLRRVGTRTNTLSLASSLPHTHTHKHTQTHSHTHLLDPRVIDDMWNRKHGHAFVGGEERVHPWLRDLYM